MSVGNVTQAINFDRHDLTLVLGENLDLGGAIIEKLLYNSTRADHKIENRMKENGKTY